MSFQTIQANTVLTFLQAVSLAARRAPAAPETMDSPDAFLHGLRQRVELFASHPGDFGLDDEAIEHQRVMLGFVEHHMTTRDLVLVDPIDGPTN